jgi:hypothetical protein
MKKRAPIQLHPTAPAARPPATTDGGAGLRLVRTTRQPCRVDTKQLACHVPIATHKRFAQLAVGLERSVQGLLEEAIGDLFAKYKA